MAALAQRDGPDPEADRRFAEAPFPLLEPVGWGGQRYRGGYGTSGSQTVRLGLLFEPPGVGVDGPRMEIQVGSEFFEEVLDGCSPREAAALVGLTSDDERLDPAPTLRVAGIQVDGQLIEFTIVSRADWWVGQGWWQGLAVEIRADQVEASVLELERYRGG